MRHLPKEKLNHKINTGGENNPTIEFLIDDYIQHLEHHLKQVIEYDFLKCESEKFKVLPA